MSLQVCSLSSGSSGNAFWVQSARSAVLVDAGLSPRRLTMLLRQVHRAPEQARAILLSHEHADHARGAVLLAQRYGLPLVCNAATFAALGAPAVDWRELPTGGVLALDDLHIATFPVAHDAADPVGYRISTAQQQVAFVTDLGDWTPELAAELAAVDLLVIEANHDLERLRRCGYPLPLQRRIASPAGHLSNLQTAELLIALHARSPRLRSVWLAHLSARSNSPTLALNAVQSALAAAGVVQMQLAVLPRHDPSPWWRAPIEQLMLEL